MSEVALRNDSEVVEINQLTAEQIELMKRTVAKGATDDELRMFLHLAHKYDLDPFAKEIWFIKRLKKQKVGKDEYGNEKWDYPRLANGDMDYSGSDAPTIMTSRDGYLKVAQRHEDYEGLISFTVCEGDNFEIDATNYSVSHKFGPKRGKTIGAWARCDRKGRKPLITYVDFNEYNDSASNTWKKYPSAMIQKVAEAIVLKRQFGLNGLVTQEEMPAEYDFKNITPENEPKAITQEKRAPEISQPQIPDQVGDFVVIVNGNKKKLSDMTMAQLRYLQSTSTNETTRAMASAYIDEIKVNEKEIDITTETGSTVEDTNNLFGGTDI